MVNVACMESVLVEIVHRNISLNLSNWSIRRKVGHWSFSQDFLFELLDGVQHMIFQMSDSVQQEMWKD
jgi:hypothetical protein